MTNVSSINKAKRLTEEEVHAAADELKESGIKPSSIEVYKFLGRGSLTTISNFLKTWNQEETMKTTLPALIMLPEALKKSAEQLIIKVWAESQDMAEREINSQREALRQAEAIANEKIAEAEAFSEEQTKQIVALETHIETIKKDMEKRYAILKKAIEEEQDNRHQVVVEKAICEQKLNETEKQFDYVNRTLIEQQNVNQALTGENIKLKNKLENAEKNHAEIQKQVDTVREKLLKTETLLTENKKFELIAGRFETELYHLKQFFKEEKKQSDKNLKDNENLREKAAMLEGELKAWKSIKPEQEKTDVKSTKAKEFKKTELPKN